MYVTYNMGIKMQWRTIMEASEAAASCPRLVQGARSGDGNELFNVKIRIMYLTNILLLL